MKKQLTCIGCPLGCQIDVEIVNNEIGSISGNTCKRGETYARKEVTNPTRIITSSVLAKKENGEHALLSVKTEQDIPKDKIFECMSALKGVVVKTPVKIGDTVLKNVANTQIDVVATRNVD